MKLMMFQKGKGAALGLVEGKTVIDLAAADPSLPKDLKGVIVAGATALAAVKAAGAKAPASAKLALDSVKPALPIDPPNKIICVGTQLCAARQGGRTCDPDLPLHLPARADLAGGRRRTCDPPQGVEPARLRVRAHHRHRQEAAAISPKPKALDYVFGYTLFNDVSVRDFQRKTSQWTPGKNFDGTGPLGPWVVTSDELPPGASGLRITTRVNGEIMQDSNTSDMIFSTAKTIEYLSEFMTLEPGDVIATGTPSGVAHARKPPAWMKAGDKVEVEVEKIGVLANPIVDEK